MKKYMRKGDILLFAIVAAIIFNAIMLVRGNEKPTVELTVALLFFIVFQILAQYVLELLDRRKQEIYDDMHKLLHEVIDKYGKLAVSKYEMVVRLTKLSDVLKPKTKRNRVN